MLTANQITNIILIVLNVIYFSVLMVGIKTNRTGFYLSTLNMVAGVLILIYWVQKQLLITQHLFGITEILALVFEMIVIASAIYFLVSKKAGNWVVILQYVFFGIHLLVLVLFFVFMLTFKMKRLI